MESRAPLQRSPSDPSQNRPLSALRESESLPGRLSGIALLTRTAAARTAFPCRSRDRITVLEGLLLQARRRMVSSSKTLSPRHSLLCPPDSDQRTKTALQSESLRSESESIPDTFIKKNIKYQ